MTVVESPRSTGLVARVQNILMKPAAEWDVIAGETATVQGLFTGYACILALLPLIGTLISRALFHSMFGGIGMMGGLVAGLVLAVVGYVLALVETYVVGLIINALAPSFRAEANAIQAMKVAVYSGTAIWVVGIISWFPVIGWLLGLAALAYTCYLLYLGLAHVMKPAPEQAILYTIVVIVAQIIFFWIVAAIIAFIGALAVFGGIAAGAAAAGAIH